MAFRLIDYTFHYIQGEFVMKKCLSVILALSVICCLLFAFMPSISAAKEDDYYYYTVKVVTKIDGDTPNKDINVYYSLHGIQSNGQNIPLASFAEDGRSNNFSIVRFQAGGTEQTNLITYYSEEPMIGVRFLQEAFSSANTTSDKHQYYLVFSEQTQKTGLENAMIIDQMQLIEGFGDGGTPILSELRDSIFSVKYNEPPKFYGVEEDNVYFTTQTVRVQDTDLVSVMLDDKSVEIKNGEALITIPGNTNNCYTVTAKDSCHTYQLTVTMGELSELMEPVREINEKNVKAKNKNTVLATLEKVNKISQQEPTPSAEEKTHIDEMKKELEGLLSRIDEALALKDSENIQNTKDITADNVKLTDKEALEKAESDLKTALEEYGGNYSDSEKESLQKDLARVSDALKVIKTIEETVTESPKTGDNSYLVLWLALFVLSGGALVTTARKFA